MSRLKLTPAARGDVGAIWDYTAARRDIDQAKAYVRIPGRSMQALADTPGLGRSIGEIRPGYMKFPTASHVIFYRKTGTGIEVVRILRKSMDVERHL